MQYIEGNLKIQDKAGRLAPLIFNSLQQRFYAEIQRQQQAGQPVRIIILKARQIGFSTAAAALFFQRAATLPNINAMIVAHKADASTNIFNKAKLFYDELPSALRPLKKASNAKELLFENPSNKAEDKARDPGLRSKIVIETAGSKDAGRSATVHCLHLSELAYWPYPEETLVSLMQAVPNLPETIVVIESTANGVGGAFYKEWRRAAEGGSVFTPLFFPWWQHQEYRMGKGRRLQLSPEEKELKKLYKLDEAQLRWRRWCIAANCGGDEQVFAQEYPGNAEEAFLLSGRPVFDTRSLARVYAKPATARYGRVVEQNGRAEFVAQSKYLALYQPPEPGAEYVIGIDVAEGLAGGDYSAMAVVDRQSLALAALWHGHMDPDLLGQEAVLLARWYNGALLAPEANNHGIAAVGAIRREHYPRLYRRNSNGPGEGEYGFLTTSRTKPLIVNALARYIREDVSRLRDRELASECLSYAYDDKGRTNAQAGCYDDRVMALAIALYAATERPRGPDFSEADWGAAYGACETTGY